MAETILPVSISEETRGRYLKYALSVIQARALPDVRDGLKPVQRRILFTMDNNLHSRPDGPTIKCAKIVGEVMGNYHPHGDSAIYDALVRLAQDWVMRVPLVQGQGNFGSVEGDEPAAYRYTEAKLAPLSTMLLSELKQQTVDLRPSYDGTKEEPVVLPAQYPNLLVNGTSGIAVGLATNIPPHNLGEVVRACVLLIENPEATTAELLNKVKGPDFPLGGKIIADRGTLRRVYEEGHGSIKVQAEWKLEELGRGKQQIVITSIPYGVRQDTLEAAIGAIIADRKLPQALGVSNESNDKEGMRVVIEIKSGADPNVVMAYLYRHTALQENFAYNMTCLVPVEGGPPRPERIGLKEMIQHFLTFRLGTVRRRFEYELAQLRRRIHILDGFRIVFNALDEAIRIIRESEGKADASEKLRARFKLDEVQTDAILDSQLYKIASLEIKKILDELKEKKKEAARIEELLASEEKLWGVIKDELSALGEKHGDRRRTRMASDEDVLEFNEEAYIPKENANVVLTRDGWIKRVGRISAVESTRVREGDEVIAVVPGSTLEHVIFFADDGTAYTMRIHDVPQSTGYGEPIAKYFNLADQVKIVAAVTTDERFTPADTTNTKGNPTGPFVLAVTAQGMTLRTPLTAFRTASTKNGRRYMRLEDGDKVVMAAVPKDETGVMLATSGGRLLHFAISQVSVLMGAGKGVIGINLGKDDACLGGALIGNRHDALVVETSGGQTKEFRRGAYPPVSRGGKGTEVVKRTTLVRVVPPPIELVEWEVLNGGREAKPPKEERNGDGHGLFE